MVGARLQLVLRVANDREGRPVVQRLVTAFTSRRIQRHRNLPNFAERLHLTILEVNVVEKSPIGQLVTNALLNFDNFKIYNNMFLLLKLPDRC